MPKNQPFYSIITSTKSAALTIPKTIESLNSSKFKDYEWIVVDCLSVDGTLEHLRSKAKNLTHLVSEPDSGIYDAWNKALEMASGEWILFLGSGDILLENSLSKYYQFIKDSNTNYNFISSNASLINDKNLEIRNLGEPLIKKTFIKSMKIVHAGAIHHKSLFRDGHIFSTKYKSSGDYEFLLRRLDVIIPGYINETTVRLLDGGISTNFNGLLETLAIQKNHIGIFSAYFNFGIAMIKFYIRKHYYKFK